MSVLVRGHSAGRKIVVSKRKMSVIDLARVSRMRLPTSVLSVGSEPAVELAPQ